MDLPLRMESDSIENEDGPGPYGSKGMSEGALLRGRRPWLRPWPMRRASSSATCP